MLISVVELELQLEVSTCIATIDMRPKAIHLVFMLLIFNAIYVLTLMLVFHHHLRRSLQASGSMPNLPNCSSSEDGTEKGAENKQGTSV